MAALVGADRRREEIGSVGEDGPIANAQADGLRLRVSKVTKVDLDNVRHILWDLVLGEVLRESILPFFIPPFLKLHKAHETSSGQVTRECI